MDDTELKHDPEKLVAMPPEVLDNLLGQMTFEDAVRYCSASRALRDICSRRGLLAARARQYIRKLAPSSNLVVNDIEHSVLIARGFVTHYNYNRTTKKVVFGNRDQNPDSYNFHIVGLPPARRTKIHLVCNEHWSDDLSGWAIPYMSVNDIFEDMKWAHRVDAGEIVEPPVGLFDRDRDGGGIINLLAALSRERIENKACVDTELGRNLIP